MTEEEKSAHKRAQRAKHNRTYYNANKVKWQSLPSQSTNSQMRHQRQRKYGVSQEQFAAMLISQGGACAICGATEAGGRGTFHVDHCHSLGTVRGLLCHNCNVGLGHFRDDTALLLRASNYLAASRTIH
jgi:hypothetical protein